MSLSSVAAIPRVVALFGFWILLWGEWSVANLLSGVVVVPLVSWLFAHRRQPQYVLRPWGALKLLWFVLFSLITSSLRVALAVVAPTPRRTVTSVQTVQLERGSAFIAAIVGNAITLTPGTMTLDVDRSAVSLSVHVLGEVDPDAFRAEVLKLERLVDEAFRSHGNRGTGS